MPRITGPSIAPQASANQHIFSLVYVQPTGGVHVDSPADCMNPCAAVPLGFASRISIVYARSSSSPMRQRQAIATSPNQAWVSASESLQELRKVVLGCVGGGQDVGLGISQHGDTSRGKASGKTTAWVALRSALLYLTTSTSTLVGPSAVV